MPFNPNDTQIISWKIHEGSCDSLKHGGLKILQPEATCDAFNLAEVRRYLILAQRNPGRPNWLEISGHRNGTRCLRLVGATHHIPPTTSLVKIDSPVRVA